MVLWGIAGPISRKFVLLLLAIVVSRLALVGVAHSLDVNDDAYRYLQEAVNLHDYGTFSSDSNQGWPYIVECDQSRGTGGIPRPTAQDMPLFPLFLSGVLGVVKTAARTALAASLFNCLFFGAAAAGLYCLAFQMLGSQRSALLAMLIFGFMPESFPYSVWFIPESMFLMFLVWFLAIFAHFLRTGKLPAAVTAFLLWACSVMTKPISLYLGPILALIAVLFHYRGTRKVFSILAPAVGLIAGLAALAPWSIRNQVHFGSPALTSMTGTHLFYTDYLMFMEDSYGEAAWSVIYAQDAASQPPDRNPMKFAETVGGIARREIFGHFGKFLVSAARRHIRLYTRPPSLDILSTLGDESGAAAVEASFHDWRTWSSAPARVILSNSLFGLMQFVLYVFALLGLVSLARRKCWEPFVLTVTVCLYFAVVIGSGAQVRYRIVMLPAMALAAVVPRNKRWFQAEHRV